MGQAEYQHRLKEIRTREALKKIPPDCVRKLVEGAVAHAEDLDFFPHEDYGFAKKIFGNIEKDLCPRSFTFGPGGEL